MTMSSTKSGWVSVARCSSSPMLTATGSSSIASLAATSAPRHGVEHAQEVAAEDLLDVRLGVAAREQRLGDARVVARAVDTERKRDRPRVHVPTESHVIDPRHLHGVVDVLDQALEWGPRERPLEEVAQAIARRVVELLGRVRRGLVQSPQHVEL